jgi:hypothetical protein
MWPALLIACTSSFLVVGPDTSDTSDSDSDTPLVDTDPEPIGDAPPDTAPETDTISRAPGSVALDCDVAPQPDGKVPCTLRVLDADGNVYWDGAAGVGLHGRSSSSFPKVTYAVELRDADGIEAGADLLGMGEEADWLLNGMWIDRALMRNKLAFDLFRALTDGREWAPESAYVELTTNGAYAGLYALTERIDRDASRLDLPLDDGSGTSFIVKGDEAGIYTPIQYAHWGFVYPNAPDATQLAGMTERLGTLDTYMTYANPAMFDELDMDAAVAFVLIEELFKNNDAFFLSHHLYVRPDGFLGWVPWDMDLTLGQPSYNDNENPRSWIAYRPGGLIDNMGQMPAFRERMVSMWTEWRATELADGAVEARIDGLVADLGDAPARNFARWPIGEVDFGGTLYVVGSHAEEIGRIKAFVAAREAWMDANIASWSQYAD